MSRKTLTAILLTAGLLLLAANEFSSEVQIGGGYGDTGATISTAGNVQANGNLTVDGTGSFGGGYGSTGVSISAAGDIQANGDLTVDGSGPSGWTTDTEWDTRDEVEAAWSGTTTIWCDDNDGTGSGLDADTVDTYEGSALAVLSEAETITGNWVNTDNPWADNEVANDLTISGGTVDNSAIGGTTPSTGAFTTLDVGGGYGDTGASIAADGTFLSDGSFGVAGLVCATAAVGGGYGSTGCDIEGDGDIKTNGDIYTDGDCSALTFTDRSPLYEGTKALDILSAIDKVQGSEGQHGTDFAQVDHDTLGPLRAEIRTEDPETGEVHIETGRDLGKNVVVNSAAILELFNRIEQLEADVRALRDAAK